MRGMSFTGRLRAQPWLGSAAVASVGRRILPPVDKAAQRLTRGRLSLAAGVGLPVLLLTTIGRRSGQPRVTALTYARDGDGLLVIGSNWGQTHQPDWALNLRAKPEAAIEIRGRRMQVTARLLEGTERAAAWELLLRVWPHFSAYEDRAGERELLIFRLTER
jgi:deazaflavin-dependent oxidoreductase (nitroreductase family)